MKKVDATIPDALAGLEVADHVDIQFRHSTTGIGSGNFDKMGIMFDNPAEIAILRKHLIAAVMEIQSRTVISPA
jgi:hypothetical protein